MMRSLPRRPRARAFALLRWLALLGAGCARCQDGAGEAALAELTEVHGRSVERDFQGRAGRWERAQIGARFALGDGVRAGARSHAFLKLQDGSVVRLRPNTVLRFLASAKGATEQGLDVQMGEAEVSAGASEVRLRTGLGVALLQAGSRVVLRRAGPERIVYRVELGSARLQSAQGAPQLVRHGEVVEVGIGMAILNRPGAKPAMAAMPVVDVVDEEPAPEAAAAQPDPGAVPATAASEPASSGRVHGDAISTGPERVSVSAAAGESFTVHSARVPVAVAFATAGRCPGEVVLVVDRKPRARGSAQVSAALGSGGHAYELRCVRGDGSVADTAAVTGHVIVLRDGGSMRLPRRAPTSFVDADGKRYTVLFQNLLPRIEFSWPGAPRSDAYTVHVETGGSQRSFEARKPEHVFTAGALREGVHRLHFTAPGRARSKTTTLEIRFDNAAPRASVSSPRDGSFAPGSAVEIAGVALPGYRVSLPGGTIELDDQFRFSGTAVTTPAQPDVALRIESPRGGVHYYVRRAAP